MSMRETDVRELSSQDHEVLGADFCSGYTDIFGKWNTGFECPRMGNGETVYCCGTTAYKYCCTRRDQHSSSSISQSVLLGSALGSVLVIVLVTLVSCLVCRRCSLYRRATHPSLNGGPLYAMHCSSTGSGLAGAYSFSGPSTAGTTPLEATPHVLLELEQGVLGRHLSASGGVDPPPPYQETATVSNSFDLRTSHIGLASQQRLPANRRPPGCNTPTNESAPPYWSTSKF
ncbi:hypothetical protein JTE90_004133 [Oedothorax gibbosus]|uniref:Shisa N-terminal domain-containing protein n=1 Tax=Oedothorax gibbosus TaxID=931172 RepID=A0AAV6UF93_9ARAC|nr:hypothetical protein JTE90_004133 [Oedothorax gibbosus]